MHRGIFTNKSTVTDEEKKPFPGVNIQRVLSCSMRKVLLPGQFYDE
ncbi:hypothetical protein [uncultured Mucilaginibacter sp.]|nr:hypothetical protein [uncultured Mucilaginibacter sp.]